MTPREQTQFRRRLWMRRKRAGERRLSSPWVLTVHKFKDQDEEIAYIHHVLQGPAPIRTSWWRWNRNL